ncbi:hypothetical protein CI610_02515 [invertebrate metagenome]|uniref:Uncharacterized protein n=1 Tax=invertebrate metagenome TaxID=1711999 RepID=A0A2H9T5P3_9ZZZZ
MASTLQREDLPLDEKMTLYDQDLRKYLSRHQQYKQDGLTPKVVTTLENFPKEDLTRKLVLQSVPKTAQSKTEMLMDRLKQVVQWNDKGEFGYKGAPVISGSNLVDLVGNATRQRSLKHVNPQGMNTFLTALRDLNVPQSWISNKEYLDKMQTVASTPLPTIRETIPSGEMSLARPPATLTSMMPSPVTPLATSQSTHTPSHVTPLATYQDFHTPIPSGATPLTTSENTLLSPTQMDWKEYSDESGYNTFSTPTSRSTLPRKPVSDMLKKWKKFKPTD